MGTRLDSITVEQGTPREALLGVDGSADRPWRLDVKSFRHPSYEPPASPTTTVAGCMKKLGTFHPFYDNTLLFLGDS